MKFWTFRFVGGENQHNVAYGKLEEYLVSLPVEDRRFFSKRIADIRDLKLNEVEEP